MMGISVVKMILFVVGYLTHLLNYLNGYFFEGLNHLLLNVDGLRNAIYCLEIFACWLFGWPISWSRFQNYRIFYLASARISVLLTASQKLII
jgi:hypothetical protein